MSARVRWTPPTEGNARLGFVLGFFPECFFTTVQQRMRALKLRIIHHARMLHVRLAAPTYRVVLPSRYTHRQTKLQTAITFLPSQLSTHRLTNR